ncbi:MAG: aldolase [Desulfobacterales bacterium]|jgi:3-dehydro-4-phosphotetronate decarboxylase
MTEQELRHQIVEQARSLFMRGYSTGSAGNISVRLDNGFLITPTNSSFGRLEPERLSLLDREGRHRDGDKPSKEWVVHRAMYLARNLAGAVVHLHAPNCMAVACLVGLDPESVLPPLTPYFVMRIGRLPLVPYFRPGDPGLAEAVGRRAIDTHAMLLAHHGMIVCESDLATAVNVAEELEETARLFLMIKDRPYGQLTQSQVAELERHFPKSI